jgi:hypothetical protein
MEIDKAKGKRGRPRKPVTEVVISDGAKRKRGRPSKQIVDGESNIKIKKSIIPKEDVIEEEYIPPKILRNKRVFRFDKRVFHMFANKYQGDIVVMGYVFDILMRMYIDNKIALPHIDEKYYNEWWKGSPLLEPLEEKELSSSHAIIRGVPVQYKYPMLVDRDLFTEFEKKCKSIYSPYVTNELVKMLMDEKNKIVIDTSRYREWCTI